MEGRGEAGGRSVWGPGMVSHQRQSLRIAAAVMLPLIILAGFQLYTLVNSQRTSLQETAMSRAEEVMRLVDSQVASEARLVSVLATGAALKAGDMPGAYAHAQTVEQTAGTWRTVRLVDDVTGREVFDLRRPLGPSAPVVANPLSSGGRELLGVRVGGIEPDPGGGFQIPIQAPVTGAGGARYSLIVELDPASIHRTAVKRFPKALVSAVVDADGRFISRTVDYATRLGSPASMYVRGAVARGGTGVYEGKTLEGHPNYTYYTTSPVTGWSTHVAIAASRVDFARQASFLIWTFVVCSCLAIAGFMIWLTLRDLAQARLEEERLRQAQKMEALGQLTGGVAHDFNNLLTAIIGGLDLVARRMPADDRNRRYVEAAIEAGQRGAKLTARLLAFSRTQPLGMEPVDLDAMLQGMDELLRQSLGVGITLNLEIAPATPWVLTDRNQLELAILNLAVNARDAMPKGGVLTIRAQPNVTGAADSAPGSIQLSVSDTGVGMPANVAARAFDPFFTTKDASKGTGLGLAQVYGLAKQSGGHARIESRPGDGTTVILDLPATARPEPQGRGEMPAVSEASASAPARKILVLDDDGSVRAVIVETLRARGHVVSQAATGEEALAMLGQVDPDLFILDFLMPGLNGAEVARRARTLRPHQKMMIVSGHFDQAELDAFAATLPILRKPFDGAALTTFVETLLEFR